MSAHLFLCSRGPTDKQRIICLHFSVTKKHLHDCSLLHFFFFKDRLWLQAFPDLMTVKVPTEIAVW